MRDSAGAASNNKPARGRLAEGYGLHVLPSKDVSLQDGRLGRVIWLAEVKKHHHACVVCTMLRGGESEIEKLANVRALPGGGGML